MKNTDTEWTQEALAYVKDIDPEIYARMQESNWTLRVADSIDDIAAVYMKDGFFGLLVSIQLGSRLSKAFAVTAVPNKDTPAEISEMLVPGLSYTTWFNRPDINGAVEYLNVPLHQFLAPILVHEFNHREGGDEVEASNAGIAFARKVGVDSITSLFEETLKEHLVKAA